MGSDMSWRLSEVEGRKGVKSLTFFAARRMNGRTDKRTGALQSPPVSSTPLVWLNIKVEGAELSSLAHDILGPEKILVRGCENVSGKMRQKW